MSDFIARHNVSRTTEKVNLSANLKSTLPATTAFH